MSNGKAKTIVAVVTCSVLLLASFAGVILYASDVEDTAESNKEKLDSLTENGSKLAQKNEKVIIGIMKDVAQTAKTVDEIRTKQEAMGNDVTYIRAVLEK